MNPKKNNFERKDLFTDGKYTIQSFSDGQDTFRRLSCSEASICLIPFDLTDSNKIKGVYLSSYHDQLTDSSNFTCVTESFNRDQNSSYFQAIEKSLNSRLGISDPDLNAIYYLGKINHTVPFNKEYRCYGFNVGHAFDPTILSPNSRHGHHLERIPFSRVIRGEISDSLILSASLLLLSYFTD